MAPKKKQKHSMHIKRPDANSVRLDAQSAHMIPSRSEELGPFLMRLYYAGAPRVLIVLVYYAMLAFPFTSGDMADSLEVFAGVRAFTKAYEIKNTFLGTSYVWARICVQH